MSRPRIVVVMGVAGCGKSTVGGLLARARGVEFIEGDDLHPPANVRRMAAGQALTDEDRSGWLGALALRIAHARVNRTGLVLSCSALKRAYRDRLREADPALVFVHLAGPHELLAMRMGQRTDHYMPASLLASQFEILEPPAADELALSFDVHLPPADIAREAIVQLAALDPAD